MPRVTPIKPGCPKGRRDPFIDGRKKNKSGLDSNPVVRAAYDRKRKVKRKIDKDIAEKQKEAKTLDEEIEVRRRMKELILKGPTPAEQRKAVLALMGEMNFSPLEELIKICQSAQTPKKDKIPILKHLSMFELSRPKPHDGQQEADASITVVAQDFTRVNVEKERRASVSQSRDEYDEFMEPSDG